MALENTFRLAPSIDVVAGLSYDRYDITRAEDFDAAAGVFEYPKGGADAGRVTEHHDPDPERRKRRLQGRRAVGRGAGRSHPAARRNYTLIRRVITDALQPNLRPTGVPENRAFLYATWQPVTSLRLTPNVELADDRWSDVSPPPAFPYVKTGAYSLAHFDATYALPGGVEVSGGFKNLFDDYYELAWGYPQPGRTFYLRTRMRF